MGVYICRGPIRFYEVDVSTNTVTATLGPVENLVAALRVPGGDVVGFSTSAGPVVAYDSAVSNLTMAQLPAALSNTVGGIEPGPNGSVIAYSVPNTMVPAGESVHRIIDADDRWIATDRVALPGQITLEDGRLVTYGNTGMRIDGLLYTVESGLPSNDIRDVLEDAAGNLWVATSEGLSRYVGGRFITIYPASIRDLAFDRENRLWAATDAGLFWVNGTTLTPVFGIDDDDVQRISVDATGACGPSQPPAFSDGSVPGSSFVSMCRGMPNCRPH